MSEPLMTRQDSAAPAGWTLRPVQALELLQARREAAGLAVDKREQALCSNACLLARVLEDGESGELIFPDGRAVLARLTAEEISALAAQWSAIRRRNDPGLARLCPDCRSRVLEDRCAVCGREKAGTKEIVNPGFDLERFWELKGGEHADRLPGGGLGGTRHSGGADTEGENTCGGAG